MSKLKHIAAIGFFDGVHIGHIKVLKTALLCGKRCGGAVDAVTFDHIPKNTAGMITALDERIALIKSVGIKKTVVLPFAKIKNLSPETFCSGYLKKYDLIVVGYNFKFGKNRLGTVATLKRYVKKVIVVKPVRFKGITVSSTEIKRCIIAGDIRRVTKFLGRGYYVKGRVIKGRAAGRLMGYPTANIKVDKNKLLPAGIFASLNYIGKKEYKGVTYIGKIPTLGLKNRTFETHLLDFKKTFYGNVLKTKLLVKLRDDRKFVSMEELKFQISRDISAANKFFYKRGVPK
ncbi:MAG: Riboflavin biosynthesis protein RibF [Elusimicrobia bacterium ADurb.Bin231]|nr:MAG: Riboflavin biosynthesis protein RibF [Elusimicrobia bacterium ADurb.Bin231]